jgi:hypothetical protein
MSTAFKKGLRSKVVCLAKAKWESDLLLDEWFSTLTFTKLKWTTIRGGAPEFKYTFRYLNAMKCIYMLKRQTPSMLSNRLGNDPIRIDPDSILDRITRIRIRSLRSIQDWVRGVV